MRPSDEYDEVAERIVFDDPASRAAIESGNDGELALCIAAVLRSHFDPGEHWGTPDEGPDEDPRIVGYERSER